MFPSSRSSSPRRASSSADLPDPVGPTTSDNCPTGKSAVTFSSLKRSCTGRGPATTGSSTGLGFFENFALIFWDQVCFLAILAATCSFSLFGQVNVALTKPMTGCVDEREGALPSILVTMVSLTSSSFCKNLSIRLKLTIDCIVDLICHGRLLRDERMMLKRARVVNILEAVISW